MGAKGNGNGVDEMIGTRLMFVIKIFGMLGKLIWMGVEGRKWITIKSQVDLICLQEVKI